MTTIDTSSISFLDSSNIVRNMQALVDFEPTTDGNALKTNYFQVLNRLQKVDVPFLEEDVSISFQNQHIFEHLVKKDFLQKSDIKNNKHLFSVRDQRRIASNIHQAFHLLKEIHPGLMNLISELIGTIICFKKYGQGGGSTSCALGLVWINPQQNWVAVDYAENIYHEFIHNSIFVDDMVNQIFTDLTTCRQERSLVTSAILNIRRPYDLAFHAAGVAVGLVHFYLKLNHTQKAFSYLEPLKESLEELTQKDFCLTMHGKRCLKGMVDFTDTLDTQQIDSGLTW